MGLPGQNSLLATRCFLRQQLQYGFCVTDDLYHQSGSEFRVASSVEQLNIIEVGASLHTKRPRLWGGGWVQGAEAELSRAQNLPSSFDQIFTREAWAPFLAAFLWRHQAAPSLLVPQRTRDSRQPPGKSWTTLVLWENKTRIL